MRRTPRVGQVLAYALALSLCACAPAAPALIRSAPAPSPQFRLADSMEVVRRVTQVFSCNTPPNDLPYQTGVWHPAAGFIDLTMSQAMIPGPHPSFCLAGFRVDSLGRVYGLPEKLWPVYAGPWVVE